MPAASIIPVKNTASEAAVISLYALKNARAAESSTAHRAAISERLRNTLRSVSSKGLVGVSTGANRIMHKTPAPVRAAAVTGKALQGIK